ncbi:N-ethylmaleimide reductase [Chitinophaga jiangningensis]|uniref:N-ethylmaleimide reductase n=1 Tax=Chitinophaga jiangningensis TaxID=1419482 RepID=A0A1M7ARW5_9BACT|nr:alkene reductase [Chitinophaga jiangningensis]SHL45484.1 N-ethylmaleimide reductase [Chitinophaga jiangningensis]
MEQQLLAPLTYKDHSFRNRIVMAPMSRRRADDAMPSKNMGIYYAQRAGAGLIIAENTAVAPNGVGYLKIPGIYNDAQQAAWKNITDQVHAQGGKIFLQLVHTGRIGHPANQQQLPTVSPSALAAAGVLRTPSAEQVPFPVPHALSTLEATDLVAAHVQAAQRAIAAGFDGVEVHGAHGFLPMQFLHPLTNNRTDQYGGSIENRSRFLLEIVKGIMAAIGPERTGLRLSPFSGLNDLPPFEEELATYRYLVDELSKTDLLYIHLSDQSTNGEPPIPRWFLQELRQRFHNLIILAGGFTQQTAEAMLQDGLANLIAFGRPFISNPDLPERFRNGLPLAPADEATFYHGGDKGLIDYPSYSRSRECAGAAG